MREKPANQTAASPLPVISAFCCEPRFFAYGIAWLTVGFVVYTIARPPTVLTFLPRTPTLEALVPTHLRPLLGSVPTFVHVMAFSMMSASVVGRTRKRILLACGGWAAIDIVFEVAQHPVICVWLLHHTSIAPSMQYIRNYLVGGTFDYLDIVAAILGAVLAGLILTFHKQEAT